MRFGFHRAWGAINKVLECFKGIAQITISVPLVYGIVATPETKIHTKRSIKFCIDGPWYYQQDGGVPVTV